MAKPRNYDTSFTFDLSTELKEYIKAFADQHGLSWGEATRTLIAAGITALKSTMPHD